MTYLAFHSLPQIPFVDTKWRYGDKCLCARCLHREKVVLAGCFTRLGKVDYKLEIAAVFIINWLKFPMSITSLALIVSLAHVIIYRGV